MSSFMRTKKKIPTWLQKWKLQLFLKKKKEKKAIKCFKYLQKQVFSITAVVHSTSLLKDMKNNFSM